MKHTVSSKGTTWYCLERIEPEEFVTFAREARLTSSDAEFLSQERHRPEIAARRDYVLVLIQVPIFDKEARVTRGASLAFIITPDVLWTLAHERIPVLEKIRHELGLSEGDELGEDFAHSPIQLALMIIKHLAEASFVKLERLHKHITIAEEAVFHGNERKMVEEIALLTRDVMDFRAVIRPQQHLFATSPEHPFFGGTERVAWRRLEGEFARLWEVLDGLSENVRELARTNDSLAQHKENQLLRLLTVYSIVAIPALVLAGSFNSPGGIYQKLFWVVFVFLILFLGFVFWRAKGKEVL